MSGVGIFVSYETLVIIALFCLLVGVIVGVSLTRPVQRD